MQTMRKEWINEGKPKETIENASLNTAKVSREVPRTPNPDEASVSSETPRQPRTPEAHNANDDDLYSATPRGPNNACQQGSAANDSLFISDGESGDQPSDDDLDLLLAEDSMQHASAKLAIKNLRNVKGDGGNREDGFADEMEAMAGLDDMW